MCGIAGIVDLAGGRPGVAEVQAMCAALRHRGPDDEGTLLGRGVALGMRRLAVIDPETGRQPIGNEDGTVWAVLNGEIYNYRELRAGLEARGHRFATRSDTETLAHLYEEAGDRCVEALRGMFAFAIWDDRRRRLLLARDRLGIKPLHYTLAGGRLLFASEIKALLQRPEIERRLDWGAAGRLFTALCTPADRTIIEGIRKLPPGHRMIASPGAPPRIERYWTLRYDPDERRTEEDAAEELRQRLDEAVRIHLVSDVPLGAFLSGGVDSSAVVASMAGLTGRPVKTFSIGFAEDDHDELRHARRVARHLGTEHHELVLHPDPSGILDDLIWSLDEPHGDSSAIPTYMVSRLAAQHVTVALSGDGGDELFGGYDKYVVEGRERRRDRLPAPIRALAAATAGVLPEGARGRNFLRHLSLTGPRRYLDAATLFSRQDRRRLFRPGPLALMEAEDPWGAEAAHLENASGHWLSALQALDLESYLPLDILTKVDRMSMAHSLEVRVPLLDHPLVEFAARLPPQWLLNNGRTKRLFKTALRGRLPADILDRPKQGFAVPLGAWLRGRFGILATDVLLSERARRRGLVEPAAVRRLLRRHAAGRDRHPQIWTLLCFELWCRAYLDDPPRPRAVARAGNRPPLVVALPGAESSAAAPAVSCR